ncbi:MAG: hypothetical protein GY714_18235 [Desulfobacterales bacterium]|nr:hypothetical protein [Desulfobacterales bacterium]
MFNPMQSRNTGPGGEDFGNKEEAPMFKKSYKKQLVSMISEFRELGATYKEIRTYLNGHEFKTPNGKQWSDAYVFIFYKKNK